MMMDSRRRLPAIGLARATRVLRLPPSGFSLIELLSVLVILSVLAGAAWPLMQLTVTRSKESDLRRELRTIRQGIDAYKRAADEGRITRKVGASGYPATLDDLVSGVEDLRTPNKNKIYFLRRIPTDPMAPPGVHGAESWGKRSYASPPDEPREGDDVYDVFSRSSRSGLNGQPYRQW